MCLIKQFSDFERASLINQLKILSKLDSQKDYDNSIEILTNGYTWLYDYVEGMPLSKEISKDDCQEVVDTLTLFELLGNTYEDLEDKESLEDPRKQFLGYDGNDRDKMNETRLMGFCRFLSKQEDWKDSKIFEFCESKDFNSHIPMRKRYQQMILKWREKGEPGYIELGSPAMNKEDILEILR